jgi:phage antirepressor YoqD-like protein/DNA-binding transcriptional regulator YiaG
LDLYFSDYKIVIECDENGHADRKPWKERTRMDYINESLEINDSHWIRFNPDEHDFDIAKVIGRIYRKIDEIKEEEKNKVIKELEKNNIIKNQDLDWKLQIEPTTCKFTAPPKEYLIEKLKTHNITDIAKGFGISTNPVSKWLKQYDINIKDFHNYDPPSKKELIERCKHKTQTEVALYYNVSNHIIRKWLKDYDLDFKSVKSDIKPVTKEELLSLMSEFDQEDIPRKLNLTIVNLQKLMKTHNIEKIPTKEELEQKLHLKSKEELAVLYNTTRTTMRKWIKSYGLEHIRCKVITNKQVIVVTENNIEVKYESISELCKDLKIGKNKVNEYMDKDLSYKGYKFISVRIS